MPHFELQILTSLQLQKRCRCQRVHLHLNTRKESERELRPDSVWCRWWDLNPHGIATNGF